MGQRPPRRRGRDRQLDPRRHGRRRRRHRRRRRAPRARAHRRSRHGRHAPRRRGLRRGASTPRGAAGSTCPASRRERHRDRLPRPRPRAGGDARRATTRRFAAPRSARSRSSRTRTSSCAAGTIESVGRMRDLPRLDGDVEELDGRGLAAIPGLVDCHTHPAFAGDRVARVRAARRRRDVRGAPRRGRRHPLDVRATRAAGADALERDRRAAPRRDARARDDDVRGEERVRARPRHRARAARAPSRRPAACRRGSVRTPCRPSIADADAYVDWLIAEVLPDAAQLAEAADVFLERGTFDVEQARRYLLACRAAGLALRLHGDQFTEIGAIALAIELGARSVDHLEATGAGGGRGARGERRRRRPASRRARCSSAGRCRRPARSSTRARRSRSRPTSTPAARSARACRSSARSRARSSASRPRRRSPPCTVNAAHVLGLRRPRPARPRVRAPTSSCSTRPTGGTSRTTSPATSSHTVVSEGRVVGLAGIIGAMATQKQRRRRAKEKRHEYDLVEIDAEGNETVLSASELEAGAGAAGARRRSQPKAGRSRVAARRAAAAVLAAGAQARRDLRADLPGDGAAARRRQDDVRGRGRPDAVPARGLRAVQLLHGSPRVAVAREAPSVGRERREVQRGRRRVPHAAVSAGVSPSR